MGIVGAMLAIPTAAAIMLLVREVFLRKTGRHLAIRPTERGDAGASRADESESMAVDLRGL